MLNQEELDRYDQDGYLILRNVLDWASIEPLRQSIADFVDEKILELHVAGKIGDTHPEAHFEKRWAIVCHENSLQKGEDRVAQWGGSNGLINETIYNLIVDLHLTDIIATILGPEIYANGDYWIRPKTPGDPFTTRAWHQDSNYYIGKGDSDTVEGMTAPSGKILSAWVPLVDVDETNGCLKLVRGSHRFGTIAARRNVLKHWVPIGDVTRYGTVSSEPMQVGDVLIFNNLTLHASGNNDSDHVRWNIDLRYTPAGQSFDWHKLGDDFDRNFPGFVARSEDPAQVTSWEQWQDKWRSRSTLS
jgi:phytanoyl-CoA hydroxylase